MTTPTEPEAHEDDETTRLREQLADLRRRLAEPEEIIRAIRSGEVDSFVVTDKQGEQIYSLRSVDALYRSMIEDMREGAVALDATGVVLYCNSYFATMVKAERRDLVGGMIFPFVDEEYRSFFRELEKNSDSVRRVEIVLRAKDGSLVPAHVSLSGIQVEVSRIFCLIVTDLTQERRREQLVTEGRRKDEFLAMLAHELRNPMAAIRASVDLLRLEDLGPDKVRHAHEVIARQVSHLNRMIDDLLDISRITRGQIRLELRPIDVASVISRAVEIANPEMAARGHELTIGLSGKRLQVYGDETRLAQVIANLLHNAAKFTPNGGHISVRVEQRGGDACIVIRDDGIGIAPEMFSKIFEAFSQIDASLERSHGGLGLGLALVRTLVEMHRGRVTVHSEGKDRGSEFTVMLPLLAQRDAPSRSTPPSTQVRQSSSPRRVLIVDDDVDASESLAMYLEELGHQVRIVHRGHDALGATHDFRPDLVLLDIGLPDLSGYAVAGELGKLPDRREFRVVALTGFGQEQDRQRAKAAGFDFHRVKPLDPRALNELLSSRAARRGRDA